MFNRQHQHPGPESPTRSGDDTVTTVTDTDFPAFTTGGYSVIDFFATWCGPCRQLAPMFDWAATHHAGQLRFGRCDVDHNPQTAARLNIMSIPTIVLFDPSGSEIDRLVGAVGSRQLDAFVTQAVPGAA
jgi:thioredoxin 1